MPIVFRCTNSAGFDESSQSYEVCNQKLQVSSDRAGTTIACPKCRQKLEVPAPDLAPLDAKQHSNDKFSSGKIERQPNVMELEFESNTKGKSRSFSKFSDRCPQCGGKYDDQWICGSCQYAEPVRHAERQAKLNTPIKLAGFQLWLTQIANEGVSMAYIGYALFSALVLFSVLVVIWGVLSTSLIGITCAVFAAFLLMFASIVVLKTRELASQPNTSLGVLTLPWNLLLFLARTMGWEKYDGSLTNRIVIDRRINPVSDQQLKELEGLESCHVLDLENSPITDAGLNALYGLPKLQCLVLKNTDVSPEAIFKLQQHKPHLWIWS